MSWRFQCFLMFPWIFMSINGKRSIQIIEDFPIGTSIYQFKTIGCPTEQSQATYRFVDNQKNFNDFFLIDPYTGRVTSKKLIDREEFCHRRMCSCAQCEILLQVLCLYSGEIFFNDLLIRIDDLNDHSPTFVKSIIYLDVLENVPVGYLIPIDVATDPDHGKNSIQDYHLYEDNSTKSNEIPQAFQVEYSKKNDLLALRLRKSLDREVTSSLRYILEASDGGQPQARTGRLIIHLNIVDVNDMSPVFDQSDLHLILSESTPIETLITRVHATDRDMGINGQISYTLLAIDSPFRLDKNTGELFLQKILDYEKDKSYRVQIKAQDNGPQQSSTPALMTIHIDVRDENDHYPLITPTFNDDPQLALEHWINPTRIGIRENIVNGTFLGHISFSDLDQGDNGRLNWTFESSNAILIQSLGSNDAFLMFTQRVFDREERSHYDIDLTVYDHGQPPLISRLNFSLIILDENDHRPMFDRDFYHIEILENVSISSILIEFNASDADEPETNNSRISYRLNDFFDIFVLDSETGELRLIKSLDREKKNHYEFHVIASDFGQPISLSSNVLCRIDLIDVNDHRPRFDQLEYRFDIDESWPFDRAIGHVHAVDFDEDFSQLTYKFNFQPDDHWPFDLSNNGTLFLKRTSILGVDYERQSHYEFEIMAVDNGGLQSYVHVLIRIHNRNDFCPELLLNSSVLYFNRDLWNDEKKISYRLSLFDGDNDTCQMELLNFHHFFDLQSIGANEFRLIVDRLPREQFSLLRFRLFDLIDNPADHSCQREVQLIFTTGSNATNETSLIQLAEDYFRAIQLIDRHVDSSFHLTIVNVIFLILIFSLAIVISLIGMKISCHSSNGKDQSMTRTSASATLYRFQGPTETQLPLLDHETFPSVHLRKSNPSETFQRDSGYETQRSSAFFNNDDYSTHPLRTFFSSTSSTRTVRLAEQELIEI